MIAPNGLTTEFILDMMTLNNKELVMFERNSFAGEPNPFRETSSHGHFR
jgi:hypothetical protein